MRKHSLGGMTTQFLSILLLGLWAHMYVYPNHRSGTLIIQMAMADPAALTTRPSGWPCMLTLAVILSQMSPVQ